MVRTPAFRILVRLLKLAHIENLKQKGVTLPDCKKPRCKNKYIKVKTNQQRRKFISNAISMGALAAFSHQLPAVTKLASISGNEGVRVAIIGGGIAGLNAAYQLKKSGVHATVYEASRRLGGRIFTRTGAVGEGLITEFGAEFINTNHEDMLGLVSELNLKLFKRNEYAKKFQIPKTGYFFNDKAWSESEIAALLMPFALQIEIDAGLLDQDYDTYAPQFDVQSVKDYLDEHNNLFSEAFIRTMIENSIKTEFGVEPDESSALQLLFNLPTVDGNNAEVLGLSDEAFVVEDGNSKIIDGLVDLLDGQIKTGMKLTALKYKKERGYRLKFNNGKKVSVDYVIMAIPFTVLRDVELKLALPAGLKRFIKEVGLGRNEKFISGFSEKVWKNNNGFTAEAWTDHGFSLVWDSTQRQITRKEGALVFYTGGDEIFQNVLEKKSEADLAYDDDQFESDGHKFPQNKFIQKLDEYIPGLANSATGKHVRTHWTKNPFIRGAYSNFKPGQLTEFAEFFWIESDDPEEYQSVRVGNVLFAGEHVSDEFYGFMNGGAQTGRLAAENLLTTISADIERD